MRNTGAWSRTKEWVRLAAKVSLLCTDPKARNTIGSELKDRVDNLTDTVSNKYEDAVDRVEAAAAALRGKTYWPSRVTTFLFGIGVGAGLGILLAPASGEETRHAVRDKALGMKNRVFESAAAAKQANAKVGKR